MHVVGHNADLETLGGHMAFTLRCPECGVTTGIVSDAADVPEREGHGHKGAHCSLHHPDPQYRHTPPDIPRMNVRVVEGPHPKQSEK